MRQDDRAPFMRALQRARIGAYAPGEFIEQESFMLASEVLTLAEQAGIAPAVSVLDLCCGVGGPGRFITEELHCDYLGVDYSAGAIEIARGRTADLPCRFEVARIPPIPEGRFEVVLLLETLLAFEGKEPLLEEIATALVPGGRFACTFEAGAPLTAEERDQMPDPDTVHLIPTEDMLATLSRAGLTVTHEEDRTAFHATTAKSLTDAFTADAPAITAEIGPQALEELLAAHRLWTTWLHTTRVRKIALVAERPSAEDIARAGYPRHVASRPKTENAEVIEMLKRLEEQMHSLRADFDARFDSITEAFESRRADDEVTALAAERIRSGAAERTEDGAEALRDLGIDVP